MALHRRIIDLDSNLDNTDAVRMLKALGSEWRIRILRTLGSETKSVNQLASILGIPPVTVAMHIKALEESGLIVTNLVSASRGLQKVCSRTCDQLVINLPSLVPQTTDAVEIAMPIGAYVDYEANPTCGLATEHGFVGMIDDPASFLEPGRIDAQLIWFRYGFVEYRFPDRTPHGKTATSVQVRMEVCSEAPTHNDDCPSDITLWINGVEVGTWTSPGDYGGIRGALTPGWWLDTDSQFGLQKRWEVTPAGTFVDSVQISDVKLDDLRLGATSVSVRIGVKADAGNLNGINLFGRKFGNYPEDLVLRIAYDGERRAAQSS